MMSPTLKGALTLIAATEILSKKCSTLPKTFSFGAFTAWIFDFALTLVFLTALAGFIFIAFFVDFFAITFLAFFFFFGIWLTSYHQFYQIPSTFQCFNSPPTSTPKKIWGFNALSEQGGVF